MTYRRSLERILSLSSPMIAARGFDSKTLVVPDQYLVVLATVAFTRLRFNETRAQPTNHARILHYVS